MLEHEIGDLRGNSDHRRSVLGIRIYFAGSTRAPYTTERLSYSRLGLAGPSMRWIMPMKTTSLVGSTQNQVPAAPSQKKVPLPSERLASGGSKIDGAVVAVAEARPHDLDADAELAGEQLWRQVI